MYFVDCTSLQNEPSSSKTRRDRRSVLCSPLQIRKATLKLTANQNKNNSMNGADLENPASWSGDPLGSPALGRGPSLDDISRCPHVIMALWSSSALLHLEAISRGTRRVMKPAPAPKPTALCPDLHGKTVSKRWSRSQTAENAMKDDKGAASTLSMLF